MNDTDSDEERSGLGGPDNGGGRPRLAPTSPATLIVAALAAAAVGWIMIARDYGDFPRLTFRPAIITAGLGALEIIAAIATKSRIDRKPGTTPVNPLIVVRYVVLAKASSLVGALMGGFFGAVLIWLLSERTRLTAAANDLPAAIGNVIGAVILLVGALLLERACRVPARPDEENDADK
ncbi:MAG TPA: DUF3180 domain-containing protein [Micromonosporaceae bacterium]